MSTDSLLVHEPSQSSEPMPAAGRDDTIRRGCRSRAYPLARGWWTHYTLPALRLGSAAVGLRAYQAAAPPLGLWRRPAHQEALARLQSPDGATSPRSSGRSFCSAGSPGRRESIGVAIAILNLIWMPLVVFLGHCGAAGGFDHSRARRPSRSCFCIFMVLYRTRVRAPTFASLGAAFSAMALPADGSPGPSPMGLFKDGVPFLRPPRAVLGAPLSAPSSLGKCAWGRC